MMTGCCSSAHNFCCIKSPQAQRVRHAPGNVLDYPIDGVPLCFTGFKLALIVGICGCLPHGLDGKKEILLGDVVSEALMLYNFSR
jgi:hypothetical protein